MSPNVSAYTLLRVAPSGAQRDRGEPWETRAACCEAPDPDIFFPTAQDELAEALTYCDRCPVRAECSTAPGADRADSGIRGDYTPPARQPRQPARAPGWVRWTPEEDGLLRQATRAGADARVALPGRTEKAIEGRRRHLGITAKRWTPEEDDLLIKHGRYAHQYLPGRSAEAIHLRRIRLAAKAPSPAWWTDDEIAYLDSSLTTAQIARMVGRTANAVRKARRRYRPEADS